jgi:hypothetical protein
MGFPIFYQGQLLFRDGKLAMSLNCCCAEPVIDCDCQDFGVRRVTLKYFQQEDGQTKFETFPMFLEGNKWTTGIVGTSPVCPDGPTQITGFTKVDLECIDAAEEIAIQALLWDYTSLVGGNAMSFPVECPLVKGVLDGFCSGFDVYANGVCLFQVCIHEFLGPE